MKEGRRGRVTETSRPAGQNIHDSSEDRDRGVGVQGCSRGAGRWQSTERRQAGGMN